MIHKKILLVDDDADDQLLFKEAIKEIAEEVECMTADNGLDGLNHLKSQQPVPSLIFLDLNMPLMNGFECLEQIKTEQGLKDIPVIIFSTSNNPRDQKKTREMGADLFLTKVSDYSLLKTKLLQILEADFSKADHGLGN
jgi:CheY-like chemotaxis protein